MNLTTAYSRGHIQLSIQSKLIKREKHSIISQICLINFYSNIEKRKRNSIIHKANCVYQSHVCILNVILKKWILYSWCKASPKCCHAWNKSYIYHQCFFFRCSSVIFLIFVVAVAVQKKEKMICKRDLFSRVKINHRLWKQIYGIYCFNVDCFAMIFMVRACVRVCLYLLIYTVQGQPAVSSYLDTGVCYRSEDSQMYPFIYVHARKQQAIQYIRKIHHI